MILHVKDAKYLQDYTIWVRFNDGAEGEVNLKDELYGEVFEPLKDLEMFKSFRVDLTLRQSHGRMAQIWRLSSYTRR